MATQSIPTLTSEALRDMTPEEILAAAPKLPGPIRLYRLYRVARVAFPWYWSYRRLRRRAKKVGRHALKDKYKKLDYKFANDLYNLAIDLQGLLIKTCQILSSRADVLPEIYIEILSQCQDRVPARPYGIIKDRIEAELGRPIEDIFLEFNKTPIAAASLGQVHEARLKTGERVAVKVQYPGIDRVVATDLVNMRSIHNIIRRFDKTVDYSFFINEFAKYFQMELDYINEGRNCEAIDKQFTEEKDVIIPKVHWEYTTYRVLVLEFIDGIKVTDIERLQDHGIDTTEIAQMIVEAFCKMILADGFFHADPHPGNIFIQPGPKVVLVDFGLAKDVPDTTRLGYVQLTGGILMEDPKTIVKAFGNLGFRVKDDNEEALLLLAESFLGAAVRERKAYANRQDLEKMNERLSDTLKEYPIIQVPQDFVMLGRVMGLLSGLNKQLDSKVDLFETMMPFVTGKQAALTARSAGADEKEAGVAEKWITAEGEVIE